MTAPQTEATTDPQSIITALQQRLDAALAREAALADELAAQAAEMATRAAELADRKTEFDERIEHQAATADVLRVMSASPGDTQPVFDLIVRRAVELCNAQSGGLFEYDGERVHIGTIHGLYEHDGKLLHVQSLHGTESDIAPASLAAYLRQFPMPPKRGSISMRAILDCQIMHIRDMQGEVDLLEDVQRLGHRSQVSLPLLRDARAIGVITIAAHEPGGFSESQIALLKTFAEQAVIAITSAETYRALQTRTGDLQETLEYQTATSDVLKVISGSEFDLAPIFQAVVETAARLCHADQATIYRYQDGDYRWVAGTSLLPDYERIERGVRDRPGTGTLVGRVTLEGRTVQIPDAWTDPLYELKDDARVGGVRTMLGVPLLRDGAPIGVIGLARKQVEPFTDRQIELVSTFADQAVIAIENTRLITEQREALEQQTATAEVLQVINASPGNLTPVFDAMLEKAMRLCGAAFGLLFTYDGERFHIAATRGATAALAAALAEPWKPTPGGSTERLIRGLDIWQISDIAAPEWYDPDNKGRLAMADLGGGRSTVWVALRKDDAFRGVIMIYRQEVRPFTDRQIALLQNFAAQAVIAMENARLLTEQREALEQQTATAEVLQVINASPGDLVPVFDAMLEKAMRLCDVAFGGLATFDGKRFTPVALRGVPAAYADYWMHNQASTAPETITGRILHGANLLQITDLMMEEAYLNGDPGRRALVDIGGARTSLAVALRKDETLLGMIQFYRQEVRPFTSRQIELLENFAAQAVIAIENTRLITEQREALEQQTATAEVLQVINASPGNLTPVFDVILEKAKRLCEADMGTFWTFDDEYFYPIGVSQGSPLNPEVREKRMGWRPNPNVSLGRVMAGENVVHIVDVTADAGYQSDPIALARTSAAGTRSALTVALRSERGLLGAITTARQTVRPYSDKQIALLQNFAAQAVIAMENARLLTETREALEQQTATAEVLQVINASPGNLGPVFEAMLEKAIRLCEAEFGTLRTWDGERFHFGAAHGDPELIEWTKRQRPLTPINGNFPLGRIVRGAEIVRITDPLLASYQTFDGSAILPPGHLLRAPDDSRLVTSGFGAMAAAIGFRSGIAVALRKDATLLGAISVYRKNEVRPFTDKQIALLQSFAAQAVIAMENARLLGEIRQRQEELRVTFENIGDGVAMFDETQHLVAWNRKFQEIFNVPDALLDEHRTYAEYVRYLAERGDFGPTVDVEEQIRRFSETAGGHHAYERIRPDGRVIEIRHNPVPSGGFVLIYADITERKRSEAEIRAARDAAEEASRTIEAAYRELKTAQANLIQAEKMASLGQLTAGIAHEIKNPLNFVNNFAALSTELIDELREVLAPEPLADTVRAEVEDLTGLLKGNLQKVVQHGQRADGIVKSMLEHSRGSSGERRMVDLNAVIDEALNLAYHGARAQDQSFNVTLERDFDEGISPIEVNPQDITRVFLNLFANGFYAVTRRGRDSGDAGFVPTLKVTTVDAGEAVEIRVRDNGTGITADIRDKLFQPFFTTKPTGEGTGLGLSITYDIVTQQHGGDITVDSKVGEYSEFTIQLPRKP